MEKTYIGLTNHYGYCCLLKTPLSLDDIAKKNVENNLHSSDFKHYSTNWNGCDHLERTLMLENLLLEDNVLTLNTPLIISGTDYDMGHEYGWTIKVVKIYETRRLLTTNS